MNQANNNLNFEACGCGHSHGMHNPQSNNNKHCHDHNSSHSHTHNDSCSCSAHNYKESAHELTKSKGGIQQTYILENLGCANCAAKMENKINDMPEVNSATITFATKQLRLNLKKDIDISEKIQEICTSIESEVIVINKNNAAKAKPINKKFNTLTLISLIFGAAIFLIGEILEQTGSSQTPLNVLFVIAYFILGGKILLTAAKNLSKGRIFDENFLMSIATLGALAIQSYAEAVGVMLFYRIGTFFEEFAVEKSRNQIMDAVDLRPEVVNLISNNETKVINANEVKVGDLLLVRPGDRIPLDGVIDSGSSRLDTSPITGEPVPVSVSERDTVVSGCINLSNTITLRVEKTLEHSMVTRILDSVENAAASKPKIDRFITRFARIYTPIVVTAALVTAIIPSLFTGNWYQNIYTALTFLVISCPCALVLSVPLAFFSGIGKGSKQSILFKGGITMEALKNITTVVMDKTGTITKGNFILQQVISTGEYSKEQILQIAASCEQHSTHPIGDSIVNAAISKNMVLDKITDMEELSGFGLKVNLNNKEVLIGNKKLMKKYDINITDYQNSDYKTQVLIAIDGKFTGHLLISDTIKSDAKASIQELKKLGIKTAMLTGDAEESALNIAKETGIDEVYAKLLPDDKLARLREIRQKNGSVMFVGDGINDAPVLANADVGAAMGSGADAAIEASDVVFMTSNVSAIPESIRIAKITNRIAWQNVIFALLIKAIVMILGFTGYASMWMAVFADSGVAMLCVLNSVRILYEKN